MSIQEMIDVLVAAREGKTIQWSHRSGPIEWHDILSDLQVIQWNFPYYNYRIKPEPPKPREWWVNVYPADSVYIHSTKADADCAADKDRLACIRVREILEDGGAQ